MRPDRIDATEPLGMAGRIRLITTAVNALIVITLLLCLAAACCRPMTGGIDYLDGRIEIPAEVMSIWPPDSTGMGVHVHGVAMLSSDWRPLSAYTGFAIWLGLITIVSAAIRNWGLYFACHALLLIPAEAFGMCDVMVNPAVITIASGITLIHCVKHRRLVLAGAALAAALALFAFHTLTDGHARSAVHYGNQVFDETGEDAYNRDPDAVQKITAAMAQASPSQRPAADYVMAQLAYVRGDWNDVKRLTPTLRPAAFTHGAFTGARLFVLRHLAGDNGRLVPLPVAYAAVLAAGVSVLLTTWGIATLWRMRSRRLRVEKMTAELTRLRQVAA